MDKRKLLRQAFLQYQADHSYEAFSGIVENSIEYIWLCARQVEENEEQLKGILKDTYVYIHERLNDHRDAQELVNMAVTFALKKVSDQISQPEDVLTEPAQETTGTSEEAYIPDVLVRNEEYRKQLWEIITGLPVFQRILIVCYYFNRYRAEDIADIFKIQVSIIQMELTSAQATIRKNVNTDIAAEKRYYSLSAALLIAFAEEQRTCHIEDNWYGMVLNDVFPPEVNKVNLDIVCTKLDSEDEELMFGEEEEQPLQEIEEPELVSETKELPEPEFVPEDEGNEEIPEPEFQEVLNAEPEIDFESESAELEAEETESLEYEPTEFESEELETIEPEPAEPEVTEIKSIESGLEESEEQVEPVLEDEEAQDEEATEALPEQEFITEPETQKEETEPAPVQDHAPPDSEESEPEPVNPDPSPSKPKKRSFKFKCLIAGIIIALLVLVVLFIYPGFLNSHAREVQNLNWTAANYNSGSEDNLWEFTEFSAADIARLNVELQAAPGDPSAYRMYAEAESTEGEIIWMYGTNYAKDDKVNYFNCFLQNDTLYILQYGIMQAFNVADGSKLWENTDYNSVINSYAFGENNTLYLRDSYNRVFLSIDDDGNTAWTQK